MQDYKFLTPQFSVSGVITATDIAKFKQLGFNTIISNLPDEEVTNGFFAADAAKKSEEFGIEFIHMPANGATVSDIEAINQCEKILIRAKGPVLAHCKTGTRSAILWGLTAARTTRPDIVLAWLENAGFDLDFLDDEFEEQWELARDRNPDTAKPAASQAEKIAA